MSAPVNDVTSGMSICCKHPYNDLFTVKPPTVKSKHVLYCTFLQFGELCSPKSLFGFSQ